MKKRSMKREYVIALLAAVLVILAGCFALVSLIGLQGKTRLVNYVAAVQ